MFTGRIYDIIIITDKIAQIVVRKKCGEAIVPVAIGIYGYYKNKALNELKLRAKDKIKGKLYMKSKLSKDKTQYYTTIFFKELIVVERGNSMSDLFQQNDEEDIINDDIDVDMDTGEILS